MMSTDEQEVLEANAAFYEAFAGRDVEAMDDLWARQAPVSCCHPGWSLLLGRRAVLESWRSILEAPSAPEVACSREVVHLLGDVAVVLCVETLTEGQLMATNVFAREFGRWRILHHHASMILADSDEDEDEDEEPPSGFLN